MTSFNEASLPAPDCVMGHSERQLKAYFGDPFGEFCEYMFGKTLGVCHGSSCDEAHGQVLYWGNVHSFLRLLKRRDRHDLDDYGSWAIDTESETFYLLRLDGDEKTIVSLTVDTGHTLPSGRHTLRCDGDAFPLEILIDPPIVVGRPARFIFGGVASAQVTSPVVEIRRI